MIAWASGCLRIAERMVFFGTGPYRLYWALIGESREIGWPPESATPWCTDLWQLRSSSSFSPGASSVWKMTLFEVEVPLVAKKVRRGPEGLGATVWAPARRAG